MQCSIFAWVQKTSEIRRKNYFVQALYSILPVETSVVNFPEDLIILEFDFIPVDVDHLE